MVWVRSAARNLGKKIVYVNTIIETMPKRAMQKSADENLIILLDEGIQPLLKAQVGARVDIVARFKDLAIPFPYPVLGIPFQKLLQFLLGNPVFLGKPLCPCGVPVDRCNLPQGPNNNILDFHSGQSSGLSYLSGPHEMPPLYFLLQLCLVFLLTHSFDTNNLYRILKPGQVNCLPGKGSRCG